MQQQDEPRVRCKIDQFGRLLIPADIRQQLHVAPGDEVLLEAHDGWMTVSTFQAVLRELQGEIKRRARPGGGIVDEVLAERRAEAANE